MTEESVEPLVQFHSTKRKRLEERWRSYSVRADSETEARGDSEEYCALLEPYVLLIGEVCFSRLRSARCVFCRYDQEDVKVRLIHVLCDMLEDRAEEARRTSET
jgi:hypothetical protein